jgi:SAM-dependent methyltransferase
VSNEVALQNYNRYLVKRFLDFSKLDTRRTEGNQPRVLDFGAGIGSLAILWEELSEYPVECFEIDPIQFEKIKSRGFRGYNSFDQIKVKFDYIYSSNVLEHIHDDVESLENLSRILNEQGRIAIYVPAHMVLFSDLDRKVGHFRRYTKKRLIRKIEECGLVVIKCEYVDSIGFFASLLIKLLGWRNVGDLGSYQSLKFYDRYIFPVSRLIDFVTSGKVIGKNILLIAEKAHKY